MTKRPPFIISTEEVEEKSGKYPKSEEALSSGRAIGKHAGLQKIGLHIERLPPGHRTSWPHAEEKEEEFVYVLEGEIDMWVDGNTYPMKAGDLAAFPAGTGICHTVINNSDKDVKVLVGGEATKSDNRIYYPLHKHRKEQLPWSFWWDDISLKEQGSHDGVPDRQRKKT